MWWCVRFSSACYSRMHHSVNKQVFNVSGKYFDEISQDTGKYCFGVEDTLKALEMGSVEILIVWENLEIMRYVLKNHQTDGESVILCVR